ncbi:MAG: hypothetical protein VSS75_012755 [Candidatus Parabeggiatoa sp.]|nr:hypothetical protein [Candidatus Parabeggiatoa sp.]
MTTENSKAKDYKEIGIFAAGGAAAGAGTSATLGGMGLAVGGTAVGIGMTPVVVAGIVVGLAAYGLKKAFWHNREKVSDKE